MFPQDMIMNVAKFNPAPYINQASAGNQLTPGPIFQPRQMDTGPIFGGMTKPAIYDPTKAASMPSFSPNPVQRPPNPTTPPPPVNPPPTQPVAPPPANGPSFGPYTPQTGVPNRLLGPNNGTVLDQWRQPGTDAPAYLGSNFTGIDPLTGYQYINQHLFPAEGLTQSGDKSVMGSAFSNFLSHYGITPMDASHLTKIGSPQFGGPQLGGAAPASAPSTTPPPQGGNPIARPPGTGPIIPNNGFRPVNNQPGGTTLPYPGSPPGTPQTWQELLGSLFNGDLAGNETRNTSRSGLDPRLDSTFQYLMGQALQRYSDPNGQQFYSGPTVAQLTPDELAAQGLLREQSKSNPLGDSSSQYLQTLLQRAQDPSQDPTVQAAIDAMTKDTLQTMSDPGGVLSGIRNQGIANGNLGGTRQGIAEGLAAARAQDSIARTSAQMRLDARDKNLQAAGQVLTQLPSIQNQQLVPAQLLSTVGQQNRAQEQANMTDLLQRWAYNTTEPDKRLQNIYSLLNATPLGGYSSASSVLGNDLLNRLSGPSTAQNVVGGLAGGAALIQFLNSLGIFK